MKKLGKVTVVTKKGELLVKTQGTHRLNSKVVNQQIKIVGKIVDIIGPVTAPFIVINTRNAQAKAKVGELLYLFDRKPIKKSQSSYKRKPAQKPRR